MVVRGPAMPRVAAAVFAGDPSPPAPLTWGQQALWTALRRRGPEQATMNLRRIVPMPRRGADVDAVLRAVATLVGRHSSLRTRLRLVDGEPRQLVADAGELPVLLHAAESDDPAAAAGEAEAVADRLAGEPFDHGEEWPQRVALVLAGGLVRHVVCVFSHTTVDFRAVELLLRELRLLVVRGAVTTPAGLQSVDVARREQDADRHRSGKAVAYWLGAFGRLPRDTLPRHGPPSSPRFRRVELVSEAAAAAVALAARRCRVTSSTVLLAAVAAVMSAWSGTDVCGIHAMAGNRALDGHEDAVAKLNQIALVVVDTADRPGFDDLLPRVWQAALLGYRHSYYDPAELRRAFEAAGLPYESGVNPHCYVNDVRLAPDADLLDRTADETAIRSAMARSTCTPTDELDRFFWRIRVQVRDAPRGLGIALTGDTGHLPPAAAERFLRDLERLLVEAAFRDVPWPWLTNVPTLEGGQR